MTLDSLISQTPTMAPPRIVLYGTNGIGKTTFAAGAPSPVLLPTEDGIGRIDVPHLPLAKSCQEVLDYISALMREEHEYQTLIVDSLDHLEPLIWQKTCEDHGKPSIEAFGYGKGYVEAMTLWRQIFDGLNYLRNKKRMAIVLIAHHEVKTFNDPSSEPYDRYQIKLHKNVSALTQEWSDMVLFASYKQHVIEADNGRTRAVGEGERVMLTQERPSHQAKNRYSLPYELPLSWDALQAAMVDEVPA